MEDSRVQEIYDNGAELSTMELGLYMEATVKSNEDPSFELDPMHWAEFADTLADFIIEKSAGSWDWRLEHRGVNNWYLHPWGK